MKAETVRVDAGGGYDVIVGEGLLNELGALLPGEWAGRTCAVVTDETVEKLYLNGVLRALEAAGICARAHVIEAGERAKTPETLFGIWEFMAGIPLTRADFALALGGGVVGDLTGFAAGSYMRGVKYAQVPTTFLACVDSSVGGKTAVNLKAGKNLAGLFYQPALVIADTACLYTLTGEQYACGVAEAIKMGVLMDAELFSIFETGARGRESEIIARCVRSKAYVVRADEREAGARKLLNLGHTYAHALEQLSGYALSHGLAVGAGLYMAARAAKSMGDMSADAEKRVLRALEQNGLTYDIPYTAEDIARAAASDKKRAGGKLSVIVPRGIGACEIRDIELSEFINYARAGGAK